MCGMQISEQNGERHQGFVLSEDQPGDICNSTQLLGQSLLGSTVGMAGTEKECERERERASERESERGSER